MITLILTSSSLLEGIRQWYTDNVSSVIERVFGRFIPVLLVRPDQHKYYAYCRLCVGFLVSLIISIIFQSNFWIIYGVSYFLATQER